MNFVKNETLKMRILSKMKCEFLKFLEKLNLSIEGLKKFGKIQNSLTFHKVLFQTVFFQTISWYFHRPLLGRRDVAQLPLIIAEISGLGETSVVRQRAATSDAVKTPRSAPLLKNSTTLQIERREKIKLFFCQASKFYKRRKSGNNKILKN